MPWRRGLARHEGGEIVLDSDRAEKYLFIPSEDVLFDLAAIRRPTDALGFVRRYGLLSSGASYNEPDEDNTFRESWNGWEYVALRLSELMSLYNELLLASGGDQSALEELETFWRDDAEAAEERKSWRGDWTDEGAVLLDWPGFQRVGEGIPEGLLVDTALYIAQVLNRELGKTDTRPSLDPNLHSPDHFRLSVSAYSLEAHAYYQLALYVATRAPLARCEDCGRLFPIRDKRQRFCSSQCGGRARYRRYAEKKRDQKKEEQ